ncbi:uncharacterized protein LOC106637673 isoform X2 [Copidosoma floridanum]|uniref:uncharacterized protein LOC106637673 isoform X2 n=1 Tax=Copidosoma floridanum TaxID=29053 RepID=UPI000C6F8F0A|nr:uncharacterized protein LOC106637673 isoform X2 [Copidosoma floridanum]
MKNVGHYLTMLCILCACTCGGKTECVNKARISVIEDLDQQECTDKLKKYIVPEKQDQMTERKREFLYGGFNFEITTFTTCNSESHTLKAVFQTIVESETECLQPPFFLGFIGPNHESLLNASLKVTSALRIPHIVDTPVKRSHIFFLGESKYKFVLKGLLTLISVLEWKSFSVIVNTENFELKNLAKSFIDEALANNFCVLTDTDDSTFVMYIGVENNNYFSQLKNASVIWIGTDNVNVRLSNTSSNSFFMMVDLLYDDQISQPTLGTSEMFGEKTRERTSYLHYNFTQEAISTYVKALTLLCKNSNCITEKNAENWSNYITQAILLKDYGTITKNKKLFFTVQEINQEKKGVGRIFVENNNFYVKWNNELVNLKNLSFNADIKTLKNFFNHGDSNIDCVTKKNLKKKFHKDHPILLKSDDAIFPEESHSEWWRMLQ